MRDTYKDNLETVRKVGDTFGLRLVGFCPDWAFEDAKSEVKDSLTNMCNGISGKHICFPDSLMARFAKHLGFLWSYDVPTEELIERKKEAETKSEKTKWMKKQKKLGQRE